MAYKNIRVLIRVDYTPITDTKTLADKLRDIEGFHNFFSSYNYFKIGDTSNYRNGSVKDMEAEELVYRYSKTIDNTEYVLDFSSRFFYIRISGDSIPVDINDYFTIVEEATRIVVEGDKFVKITNYGAAKEFEKINPQSDEKDIDKTERDAYTSQPENVRIIYQIKQQKESTRYIVAATVGDVKKNPDYQKGEKLYDLAFFTAFKKAEEHYERE